VISPFTENAAQEFMRKSGLTLNPDLLRAVLREAAENEQTLGLIRPVTINLCGLVLSRFFGNSREKLMLSLLGDGDVTPEARQSLVDYLNASGPLALDNGGTLDLKARGLVHLALAVPTFQLA